MNQVEQERLQHVFSRHKEDWGFTENGHWDTQNRAENSSRVYWENLNNVYSGSYRDENTYPVIHRGGDRDYQLWSGLYVH